MPRQISEWGRSACHRASPCANRLAIDGEPFDGAHVVAFPGAETESREAMPDAAGHVDVAIVGGGVCGLALASALVRCNTSVRLWEIGRAHV